MNIDCPVIEIENLSMNYGEKEVLKGLNLTVNHGQIVGYINLTEQEVLR
jgi:ABC-type multidrug transport system ATPase subunit